MAKTVMKTKMFELTEDYVELSKVNLDSYTYDDRMDMIIPTFMKNNPIEVYKQYVRSFCELINRDHSCRPSYMPACGFLPVGVEPTMMCGMINRDFLIPMLHENDVTYFMLKPMSPVRSSYEPTGAMATSHDIWVNKLDAAKLVHKPAHNITALDVLEALGL